MCAIMKWHDASIHLLIRPLHFQKNEVWKNLQVIYSLMIYYNILGKVRNDLARVTELEPVHSSPKFFLVVPVLPIPIFQFFPH